MASPALPGFGSLSIASLDAALCPSTLKGTFFSLGTCHLAEEAPPPVELLL